MSSVSPEGLGALTGGFLVLSCIVVTLRFYVRNVQKASVEMDDLAMLLGLTTFAGVTVIVFITLEKPLFGSPPPKKKELLEESSKTASQLYISFDMLSTSSLAFVKISALFFYRRIFCPPGHRSAFSILTIVSVVVVALWTVTFLVLLPLQCGSHSSAFWINTEHAKYCVRAEHELLAYVVTDVISDVWIVGLPIPEIWVLQITLRRRLAVIGVFLLAIAGLVAFIARMVTWVRLEAEVSDPNRTFDGRLVETKATYLAVLKMGVSLIAANLPSIWFLFTKIMPENVFRSVRGIISRQSKCTSSTSKTSHALDKTRNHSSSSNFYLTRFDGHSLETHAMHDIDEGCSLPPVPYGNIGVTETITQTAERV